MTNVPPQKGDREHAAFTRFHEYLASVFPLVHTHLNKRVINEYSLLYTWEGKNKDAEPMVLMAHQDVVPVLPETLNQWSYPPFSGYIDKDSGRLWGRGSGDTKATLLGTLEAVEELLTAGFVPNRTVFLAYGHDEEISGHQGANKIAQYLAKDLQLAGKVGLIVDEGPSFTIVDDVHVAAVGTGEKGYVDVSITVETKGGHSSVPPKHTGIGYSALLIAALESSPYPTTLSDNNPILGATRCYIEHSERPDPFIERALRHLSKSRTLLAKKLAESSESIASLLTTTQAVDIIQGGLKVNALPEKVVTIINHRIAVDSSLVGTQTHIYKVLKQVAKEQRLNLTIVDFASDSHTIAFKIGSKNAVGQVTVEPAFAGLEPSPTSPSNGDNDLGWNVLEGTIHHVFDKSKGGKSGRIVVGPNMMPGNTDTRHYWALGTSIYRFAPTGGANAHTVDEYIEFDGYFEAIRFYRELIRNWSEA
ncbi:carboxypeptidase S [Obelidium mucronatum]|nr:carboxypeptidase S [Obelidium mucronatum]